MKTLRQLCRQPLKTLLGIVLMTFAVAILCVCVGQALAEQETKQTLNQHFSSIAIPLIQENEEQTVTEDMVKLDPQMRKWLEEMAKQHPDVLQGISQTGILSAYIPELKPLNITSDRYELWADSWRTVAIDPNIFYGTRPYNSFEARPDGMPQSCAMFVITLEEVKELYESTECFVCDPNALREDDFSSIGEYFDYWIDLEKIYVTYGYYYELSGTITQVVSLSDTTQNVVGMTARLKLKVPAKEALGKMNLVAGEQYIVYGMDFFNEHWKLSGELRMQGNTTQIDPFDPSLLMFYTEEEKMEQFPIVARYGELGLNENDLWMLNSVSMTLDSPLSFVRYDEIRDETGYLLDMVPQTSVTFTNASGATVSIPNDDYSEMYQIPSIARLEGSVEVFLNSPEGAIWQEAVARDQINNHAFAVLGVDRLNYLETFAFGGAKIVTGRDFTEQEREKGARVCIVNEKVAALSGLQVGDTISLNMYAIDFGLPYQQNLTDGRGLMDPLASFYFDTTPFVDTAEYTIVGFWRGERTWADLTADPYAISVNTVFVPKSSVQAAMDTSDSIVFNIVVVRNGKLEEFKDLLMEAGYAGRFRSSDQGYTQIAGNFHNYEKLAQRVSIIGITIYGVLLFLYLLLYPGSQSKLVKVMQSVGATMGQRFMYVMRTVLAVLIPASALGGLLGIVMWDELVGKLRETAGMPMELQIELRVLVTVMVSQLTASVLLSMCVALFVSHSKRLSFQRLLRRSHG